MSKAVLISIKPEWVEKILRGDKTIEIRKTMPRCDLPLKVYIYETKKKYIVCRDVGGKFVRYGYLGRGQVIGEFTLNRVEVFGIFKEEYGEEEDKKVCEILPKACLTDDEFIKYSHYKMVYAWHIDDFKLYYKPKELSEFTKPSCKYENICKGECNQCEGKFLIKAPQSWYYVEEL